MANEASRAAASTTALIVWDTADKYLRNVVEPQEYGDYILPFTVLRRLECLLEDTKDDVIEFVKAQTPNGPDHRFSTRLTPHPTMKNR